MSLHHIETYETHDGKVGWRIKVGDDIIANDARQGYNNRQDALHSLFGIWFGTWDDSFLSLYAEWQSYAGEGYENPPEAQDGPPVHIAESLPYPSAGDDTEDADAPGDVWPKGNPHDTGLS